MQSANDTQLFPLDDLGAEVIFAPLHDPHIAPSLGLETQPVSAIDCKIEPFWCYTNVRWAKCDAGKEAAALSLSCGIQLDEYDRILFCLNAASTVEIEFSARIDDSWEILGKHRGAGTRHEYGFEISGKRLQAVKLEFVPEATSPQVVHLSWFGLRNEKQFQTKTRPRIPSSTAWEGLIKPVAQWGAMRFACGILFDDSTLASLRTKSRMPIWAEHFSDLEKNAAEFLLRQPEDDLGTYLPTDDQRYIRDFESGKKPYHTEALVLGFVGMVTKNQEMIHHALRYLMCMLHTKFWVQSAESKLTGSTWDQRCFMEEMTATSVALLADWFDDALTDRAKDLVRQSIWDKGLATIERDMAKFEYLHRSNQGISFSRARIIGGAYLSKSWPRMKAYVEQAYKEMDRILDNFILRDGGTSEGPGYYCQAFHSAVFSLIGYARFKGRDYRKYVAKYLNKTERFVRAVSSSVPGKIVPTGDCRTDYFCGDVVPVMAGIDQGSVFAKILKPCIQSRAMFDVTGMLAGSGGLVGMVYGPEKVQDEKSIAPGFSLLKTTGHLASFRQDDTCSIGLHLLGSANRPMHAHLDKGSIVLEINGTPLFIDRGMIAYQSSDAPLLVDSSMHNLLTPITASGSYPNQQAPRTPLTLSGRGNNKRLKGKINLESVWPEYMHAYSREIQSGDLSSITIVDQGELKARGQLSLHFHSTTPYQVSRNRIEFSLDNVKVILGGDWIGEIDCFPDSTDLHGKTVNHFVLKSEILSRFNFVTTIDVRPV